MLLRSQNSCFINISRTSLFTAIVLNHQVYQHTFCGNPIWFSHTKYHIQRKELYYHPRSDSVVRLYVFSSARLLIIFRTVYRERQKDHNHVKKLLSWLRTSCAFSVSAFTACVAKNRPLGILWYNLLKISEIICIHYP